MRMNFYALALWLGCSFAGCKARTPAASVERKPVATETSVPSTAPPMDGLNADEFTLPDDVPADPAEVLNALRNDCCDEMPADEVQANVREAAPSTAPPPAAIRAQGAASAVVDRP